MTILHKAANQCVQFLYAKILFVLIFFSFVGPNLFATEFSIVRGILAHNNVCNIYLFRKLSFVSSAVFLYCHLCGPQNISMCAAFSQGISVYKLKYETNQTV